MKSIFFVAIFSLLGFGLMAEETTNTNNTSNDINRNSFVIGFGGASNSVKVSFKDSTDQEYSPYERIPEIDAKSNFNLTYLRKLSAFNNKLSIGVDFTYFLNKKLDKTEREIINSQSYGIYEFKADYKLYALMLLADYELLKISKFDLSAQFGLGFIYNDLSIDNKQDYYYSYTLNGNSYSGSSSDSSSGSGSDVALASKIGLVGNYNFAKHFAVGTGIHYTYMGETEITILNDSNKFKNNGIVTYNVNLKWMF